MFGSDFVRERIGSQILIPLFVASASATSNETLSFLADFLSLSVRFAYVFGLIGRSNDNESPSNTPF